MPEAIRRTAEFFDLGNGNYPARHQHLGLKDRKVRAHVGKRIIRAELGNYGKHRRLDGDLLELKEDKGPGFRIYLGEEGQTLLIIVVIGDKSNQSRDIDTARQYWAIHKQRKRRASHGA
jgi:putative addiction module killer protein